MRVEQSRLPASGPDRRRRRAGSVRPTTPARRRSRRSSRPSPTCRAPAGAAVAGLRFVELLGRARACAGTARAFAAAYRARGAPTTAASTTPGAASSPSSPGGLPDGVAPARRLRRRPGAHPARPAIPRTADRERVTAAMRAFVAWYDAETGPVPPTSAWQRDRMEYEFAVAAPRRRPAARSCSRRPSTPAAASTGRTFDRRAGATLGAGRRPGRRGRHPHRDPVPRQLPGHAGGALVGVRGRHRSTSAGSRPARPTCCACCSSSFAIDYGNDWFVVPVELRRRGRVPGALARRHGQLRRSARSSRPRAEVDGRARATGGCSRRRPWPTTLALDRRRRLGPAARAGAGDARSRSRARCSRTSSCCATRWPTWRGPSSARSRAPPAGGSTGRRRRATARRSCGGATATGCGTGSRPPCRRTGCRWCPCASTPRSPTSACAAVGCCSTGTASRSRRSRSVACSTPTCRSTCARRRCRAPAPA